MIISVLMLNIAPKAMKDNPVHVAVGVVFDVDGKVLITRRPEHVHQGGLWEFPGGKVESGEDVRSALTRELQEELGIEVIAAQSFLQVRYAYPDKLVLLDVWWVKSYKGQVRGIEGQAVDWLEPEALYKRPFPAANHSIIEAICQHSVRAASGLIC